ncbi:YcaO-like family protein [Desulfatibacillum aliphaticivorans]|uniref:YcaO-like family protein n=1 Tax=Desulfatibacillum aliphaticivorans TaxID=218208 RepID=UPI0003FFF70C|nr:YcaO-like family protein [Desulfatibacillum aliphaticivorans]
MPKIELKDAIKTQNQDQDKVITPEETLERFRERLAQVDLDILEKTVRVDNGRLDIPVFMSMCGGDARALTGNRKQMGKGGTPAQAEASAVMELAERFSLYAFSNNPGNFVVDTQLNLRGRAMAPHLIAQSVNDDSEDLEKALGLFSRYPQRWRLGANLTTGQQVMVPFDWFFSINEFNGTSAGNVTEEALCQGISEVVERHVCARVSRESIPCPLIRRDSITDPMALELIRKFDDNGVELFLVDLTLDMGIPTVGALAYDPATMGESSEIVWTAGTAPNPQKALCRAITEVAQLAGDFNSGANYLASGLPKPKSLEELDFILKSRLETRIQDMPDLSNDNIRLEVEALAAALEPKNMEVIAIETTHPGLGIPAFYSIIPGAHFRERAKRNRVGLFLSKLISENEPPHEAMSWLLNMDAALPGRYYLIFNIGVQYMALDDPETALTCFKKAMEFDPEPEDAPSILVYMGVALKDMGRYQEALGILKKAEAMDPDRTDCHNLMGFCYFSLRRHEEAIASFQKVIDLDPGSAIDYANIASNYRDMGETEMAIQYYKQALALDPSIDFARANLERLAS